MAGPDDDGAKPLAPGTVAKLTRELLDNTFHNIIYDIVAKVHREEKMAKMRSAVVIAKQKAEEEATRISEANGVTDAVGTDKLKSSQQKLRLETDGAVYEDGKVFLKGNPLKTTKEIVCPECHLPRLLHPTTGIGTRLPPDPYREYCQRHPPINKPGHDVHGNPFATDKLNTKKKKQTNNTSSNTPASSPPSLPSTPATGSFKYVAPKEVSFPTVKCPNCPRYFVVTRVAQHLDRCMGISGRQVSRNRTPMETGSGTGVSVSKPPQPPKRPRPNDEDSGIMAKKKKPNTPKKLTGQKIAPPSKLKNGTTPGMLSAESTDTPDTKIKKEINGDVKSGKGKESKDKASAK